jgi:hypothetical protein
MLRKVFSRIRPLMSPPPWFLATRRIPTANRQCQPRILPLRGTRASGVRIRHTSTQALAVHDNFVVPRLGTITEVIECGLSVDVEARLVRLAGRDAVTTVFEHEDVAAACGDQHARNGQTVADVASVAMEHQHRHLRIGSTARTPDVEGRQLLPIVGWNDELLVVSEIKLARAGDVGSSVGRDVGRIDQGPAGARLVRVIRGVNGEAVGRRRRRHAYFCLK